MRDYTIDHSNDLSDNDVTGDDTSAAYGSYSIEEALMTKYDVRVAFRRLPMTERVVVALLQRYATPPGYGGPWPPTPAQVGDYLRVTFPEFGGAMVSARQVLHLHAKGLRRLRKWLERGGIHHAS